MQVLCERCGVEMILGRIEDTHLAFVVSVGTATSLNPLRAVLQGMHGEPAYREEICPVRGRICPRCGRFEFCLDEAELAKVVLLAGQVEVE
jgi:hypothetical protein